MSDGDSMEGGETSWDADTARASSADASTPSLSAKDAPELPAGAKVGRYEIVDRLGAGGMGVVYRAHDPQLDREVALKLLRARRSDDRELAARMIREAKAAAKIRHPNVIVVYDAGEVEGRVFIAMELMSGVDLGEWFATRPPWQEIVRVMLAAAEGLRAAHDVGLVHRDFKPDNVVLEEDGKVKVLDFGLARPAYDVETQTQVAEELATTGVGAEGLETLTRTGALLGTPVFMAPEQYRHEPLDARTDQFAFCVALFLGVYDQRPFGGRNHGALALNVVNGTLREPQNPALAPIRLLTILRKGLARDPDDRYPSMEALIRELEDLLAREARRRGRGGRLVRALLPAAALAAAAALAGMATSRPSVDEILAGVRGSLPEAREVEEPPPPPDPALELELAAGRGRNRPVDGPRIWITPDTLRVQATAEGPVRDLPLEAGRITAATTSAPRAIPPVTEALEPARSQSAAARYDPVTLFVDRSTPFATIVRTVFASGRAGFARFDFAVRTGEETRVLAVKPPIFAEGEVQLRRRLALELFVRGEQVEVSARVWAVNDKGLGEEDRRWPLDAGGGSCALSLGSAEQLESLADLAAELCGLDGVSIPLVVSAEDEVSWAQVAAVISAALPSVECSRGVVINAGDAPVSACASPLAVDELGAQLDAAAEPGSEPEPEPDYRRWCFINSRLRSKKVCKSSRKACIAEARHWVRNPKKRCKGEL